MKPKVLSLTAILFVFVVNVFSQQSDKKLAPILTVPRSYTILKTSQKLSIDGKDDDGAWSAATWSEPFEDIEGKSEKKPATLSRFKLLWDDENLYLYCRFEEEQIWATSKEHDQSIYQDNALEMFIDPDGDTHNYMEFQINAFAAIWDLLLTKPPRNGGSSVTDWDIKGLKKAVFINGTLNNSADEDKFWSIELAVPLKTFRFGGRNTMPKVGSIWKMNVTRVYREVMIKDGVYVKKTGQNGRPLQPEYSCWSVPGLVNFHYPERWGIVRFADEKETHVQFLNLKAEQLKLSVWKYYYLMQEYKVQKGKYPATFDLLKKNFPEVSFTDVEILRLYASDFQFVIKAESKELNFEVWLDHESKFNSQFMR